METSLTSEKLLMKTLRFIAVNDKCIANRVSNLIWVLGIGGPEIDYILTLYELVNQCFSLGSVKTCFHIVTLLMRGDVRRQGISIHGIDVAMYTGHEENTVGCRYNAVQYNTTFQTILLWLKQNIN